MGNPEAGNDENINQDDGLFDDAFDVAEEKSREPEAESDDKEAQKMQEEPPAAEPVKEEPPAPAPEKKAEEPKEDYEEKWKSLQGIWNSDKAAWAAEKAKLEVELEQLKTPEAPKVDDGSLEKKKQDFIDSLTDDQKDQLEEYERDFDVVSKMEGLKRDRELAKLRKEFTSFVEETKKEILTQLEPATSLVKETKEEREIAAHEAHFQTIRNSHSDFEVYRDNGAIIKWIESKPSYLRKGMMETYNQGEAEDVVGLLDDFKAESNIQPSSKVVPLDSKKEQRRQALTPPQSRKSAINTNISVADDFEGAFDEALNK